MDMDYVRERNRRYSKFVFTEIGLLEEDDYIRPITKTFKINLPRLQENGKGGYDRMYVKMGIAPSIMVNTTIIDVYSRSAKVLIKYDDYEKEIICYAPYSSSPDSITGKFYSKVEDTVIKHLLEVKPPEYFINLYNEACQRLGKVIKKVIEKRESKTNKTI